jgi:D-xylose transport system substrate-binding protein
MDVLQGAIDSGAIKNVGEAYTDGWLPANAQQNMEQFLTAANNEVDAVVASNDGTAGGAIAALQAQGLAGSVPVSGQDADHAALNRIALGTQTVSVWKDSRELGKRAAEIAVGSSPRHRHGRNRRRRDLERRPERRRDERRVPRPLPITQDNLNVVIDAGWVPKETVCQGVEAGSVAACN